MENIIHIYNIIFYSVQHKVSVLLKIYSRYPRLCKRGLSHTFKLLATYFNFLIVSSKSSSTFWLPAYFSWQKADMYKLVQVFFCFSCYNYFIIHIFLSYLKSHHLHFGNFPFLKILWIVPVFEASLLLS